MELQIKNELDPRVRIEMTSSKKKENLLFPSQIRFPASVFSHKSSACGVVVTHQLPNVFFSFLLPPPLRLCVRDGG